MDALDFEFRFERAQVRVDLKEKRRPLSSDIAAIWPDVPPSELFVVDETCYRGLMWAEEMGYLLVHDLPLSRWHVFGPWELCLGPRRRFQRRGDRGVGEFLKGKLLVDLRTAAATSPELRVDVLLDVVRSTRASRREVGAIPLRGSASLPTIPVLRAPPKPVGLSDVADSNAASKSRHLSTAVADPTWGGLDPGLVAKIRGEWGWDVPTEIQAGAFAPILKGANVLVLAPTAGGKTEAALLPLLDVIHRSGWAPPSLLMISPLKALLDDQLVRYRSAADLIGATAFAWHGDISSQDRKGFLHRPTDILLTTPESLEMLLSRPSGHAQILDRIRAVVVDEVHVFAGSPRGAQLASLLERVEQRADTDFQRVGLSATVGNPAEVLAWLSGGSQREAEVIQVNRPMRGEQLVIASYETADEAATTIRAAVTGRRALVFAPSRRRAEQLAVALGVPVHHSSVSAGGRSEAVRALTGGHTGCIVATSGLEMGIDIGDVELVVNDGAPSDAGSYLQRLGRAGRRDGNRRMLMTVDSPDALILALAVVAQARRGQLDPVPPSRGARLVLGQQILAMAFERTILTRTDVREYFRWSPLFGPMVDDISASLEHLLRGGWMASAGENLVVGPRAQDQFGGRGFSSLLATFEGVAGAIVLGADGSQVGTLDWGQVSDASGEARPDPVMLGGKAWTVTSVDRAAGTVSVTTAARGRIPSWRGPSLEVRRTTWGAAREVLVATDVPVEADVRAIQWLQAQRRMWLPRLGNPVREEGGETVVDAFAGVEVHRAVLRAVHLEGSVDGPTCTLAAPLGKVAQAATAALVAFDVTIEAEAALQASRMAVRHRQLVAPSVALEEARRFHVDTVGIRQVLELIAAGG